MLSTAIILPGEAEMLSINSLRNIVGVEWDGIFYSGNRVHPTFDKALIYSSPEIIPLICDLLIIADPRFCDYEYLSFAIRSGCHLFLSDKLKLNMSECKELALLATEGGTSVRIQNDFMMHPNHKMIPILSNQSAFIEVSQTTGPKKEQVNQLLKNNLKMILRTAGSQVHKVDVFCGMLPSLKPDIINIHLNFKNGSVATLKLRFVEQEEAHHLSIHKGGEITLYNFHQNENKSVIVGELNKSENDISNNLLLEQIGDFVKDIGEKNHSGNNLNDEMIVFILMEKIRKKIENQIDYKILV